MPEAFDPKERDKRLMAQLSHMRKKMGKEAVRALSEAYVPTPCHSTGIHALDKALNGGFPKGRIIEAYGAEGGGKTTLAMSVGVQAQKAGGIIHLEDVEHKFDESMAEFLGIDRAAFTWSQPRTSEIGWANLGLWVDKAGPEDLAIMDSLAAMTPQEEEEFKFMDKDQKETFYGSRAKLNRRGLHTILDKLAKTGATLIIINQIRYKMGVVYGNPETTPGGDDLKFQSSLRLRIMKGSSISRGDNQIGHQCNIYATKSNHCRPYQKIEVPLVYGKGFDANNADAFFERLLEASLVVREGPKSPNYMYGDNIKITGRKNFITMLESNAELHKWFVDALAAIEAEKKPEPLPEE